MAAGSRPGPSPGWWNGVGVVVVIVAIVVGVPLLSPRQESPPVETLPPSSPTSRPGRTITLDEFRAMLTDNPGEPPDSIVVDTPEGPVTVVIPSTTTTQPPRRTTTTTTSTTTTTLPPRPTLPPVDAADILDNLFPNGLPPVTLPEVVGDAP